MIVQLQKLIEENNKHENSINGNMLFAEVNAIQARITLNKVEIEELSKQLFKQFVQVIKRNKHEGKYDRAANRYTQFWSFIELDNKFLTVNLRYDGYDEPDTYEDVKIPLLALTNEEQFAKQQIITLAQQRVEWSISHLARLEKEIVTARERLAKDNAELQQLVNSND
ncbi:hypothetical protein VPHK567_0212 [Vibrio phage K567]